MSEPDFDYDVAFSFHTLDEGIATQLNDLLQDRFKTFLYSKRQEEIAGRDGEETFNSVFGKKARIVAVLYRQEWGKTPFTRIEETAIRNRAFQEGFDFTVFIPTDENPNVPPWLPKTRIYAGLKRFGLQGVAAVIEARIEEAGGQPHVETLTDRAARFLRQDEVRKAKEKFRTSSEGVNAANLAFKELFSEIEGQAKGIAASGIDIKIKRVGSGTGLLLHGYNVFLHLFWRNLYSNTLENSTLNARFTRGAPRIPELMVFEEPQDLGVDIYNFELLDVIGSGYVNQTSNRTYSVKGLASELIRQLIDEVDKLRRQMR